SARVFEVSPDPPDGGGEDDETDQEVEAVKPSFQRLVLIPLRAEHLPDVSQRQTPRERTEKRINNEARHTHARHARRERDKGAHDRQQAAGEDDDLAVAREPTIRQIEIVARDQNILAVL